jgi:hypothetical protein
MNSTDNRSKAKQALKIAAVVLAVSMVLVNANMIFGLISTVLPLGSSGVISSADINAYQEAGCINERTSINWGTISPGGSDNVIVYLKNTGNVALSLSLSTDDWVPQGASTYIFLTWNYADQVIQPDQVLPVTFTLTISSNIVGITDFNFNIYITATEAS